MPGTWFVGWSLQNRAVLGCCREVANWPYVDTCIGERGWLLIAHVLPLGMEETVSELLDRELKRQSVMKCFGSHGWKGS